MLHGLGIETGVDLDKLVEIGQWICSALGKEPASKAGRAMAAKRRA
jgi:hydroxymethylglutaryl-CoA lyase